MKIWDVVKTVGAAALNIALPGTGGIIVDLVNECLPDEKKLPATATGHDVETALLTMPPSDRARLMEKELDVDITRIQQSNETLRAMLTADEKSNHTTRPYIAKGSFQVVAFCICAVVVIWAYGVLGGDTKIVDSITSGWPFVLSVIGPLITLLWAYFGILKTEHKNRLQAVGGIQNRGILGAIVSAIKS